jgi:hypothetical protein
VYVYTSAITHLLRINVSMDTRVRKSNCNRTFCVCIHTSDYAYMCVCAHKLDHECIFRQS